MEFEIIERPRNSDPPHPDLRAERRRRPRHIDQAVIIPEQEDG